MFEKEIHHLRRRLWKAFSIGNILCQSCFQLEISSANVVSCLSQQPRDGPTSRDWSNATKWQIATSNLFPAFFLTSFWSLKKTRTVLPQMASCYKLSWQLTYLSLNPSLNFLQLLPDFYQQLKELVCCVPMPVIWLLNWANCPHLGLILVCLVCFCSRLSPSWSSWSALADFRPVVVQLSIPESGEPLPVFSGLVIIFHLRLLAAQLKWEGSNYSL